MDFLMTAPGLNKTDIGDYIGEDKDIPTKVRNAYIDSFKFQGMGLVESLKQLLSGFRLPGEGQKVDRIMEKFGEKYVHDMPESF
jgi:Sec7-like guanine-nucleotide exchange factor